MLNEVVVSLRDEGLIEAAGEAIRIAVLSKDSIDVLFTGMSNSHTSNPPYNPVNMLRDVVSMMDSGRRLYSRFRMKDSNGKTRDLSVPQKEFLEFVKHCLVPLVKSVPSHSASHGGEKGWAPRRSVATHLPIKTAFSTDLSNAVPGVGIDKVSDFYYSLFMDSKFGFLSERERKGIAGNLAYFSTVYYSDREARGLPVGSGLSNHLFNRVFRAVDDIVQAGCGARGFRYSRWVDDLTVTSPGEEDARAFFGIIPVVQERGFKISPTKTYIQRAKEDDIYLLGQIVVDGIRVVKNSRALKEANKKGNINIEDINRILSSGDYSRWM